LIALVFGLSPGSALVVNRVYVAHLPSKLDRRERPIPGAQVKLATLQNFTLQKYL
jgi:hypothetical protein